MENSYFKDCIFWTRKIEEQDSYLITDEEKEVAQLIKNNFRRTHFLFGRHCLHLALEKMGHSLVTIGKNCNGSLNWQKYKSITGSLSHCKNQLVLCLSKDPKIQSIGIDLEPANRRINFPIVNKIMHYQENWTNISPAKTLKIFCLKEATIKCFGQINKQLKFKDIYIKSFEKKLVSIPSLKIESQKIFLTIRENFIIACLILRNSSSLT